MPSMNKFLYVIATMNELSCMGGPMTLPNKSKIADAVILNVVKCEYLRIKKYQGHTKVST